MSHYNTCKKRNVENVEDECEVNTMKPIKQEILMWQNKAELLQNKVNELEALNSELRQQVVELSAQQNLIPSTSVAHGESGADDLTSDGNTSTDVESSVTEESCDDSSSSSSSEETQRKTKKRKNKKNKSKKHKKNKKKGKNEYDKIKRGKHS
ncbi:pre-mRNA-splicing factor CWC22 homolog [Megalobrama amblycephala]|uniref:pre-mRNA-splicing factor CWC22 homolog n=1 Tax=Megalobrama amblycephala TaxID=75352 RepID=UPI002013E89F|nr:pre-mRNA-splicing factor CWC22 homolog [Megalobrama amblycephala]